VIVDGAPGRVRAGGRSGGGRSGRIRWALTRRAFDGLLHALDPDKGLAAQRYEWLRRRLILFFLARGVLDAEARADETLDRVSRRIDEGAEVRDLGRFAYGVARLVCSESLRRDRRQRAAVRRTARPAVAAPAEDPAPVPQVCVRRCMALLREEERALIVRYYDGQGAALATERRALADSLGLSPAALRLRMHRIRRALEPCVRRCMESGARRR